MPEPSCQEDRTVKEGKQPIWTGLEPPPPVGSYVNVGMNKIGPSRVVGYFVNEGYLGVAAKPLAPPDWYLRQNGYNATAFVFGREIAAFGIEPPQMAGPSPEQLAAVQKFAINHGRTWKKALGDAWLNGADDREPDGALLRQVRNQFGPEWLKKCKIVGAPESGKPASVPGI